MSEELQPPHQNEKGGLSRRGFLKEGIAIAAGALAAAAAPKVELSAKRSLLWTPIEPVRIGEFGLAMKGVAHIPETFELMREEIETVVKEAPFIIMEGFGDVIARLSAGDVPPEMPAKSGLDELPYFYASVAYLARKHKKDIVVVNPEPSTQRGDDWYQFWVKSPAAAVAAGVTAATGLLTRRRFMKLLLASPLAAQFLDRTSKLYEDKEGLRTMEQQVKLWEEKGLLDGSLPHEEKIGYFLWNTMNWRDVSSALGTRAAMMRYEEEWRGKDVPAFDGAGHQGMLYYLKHPTEAEVRRKTYLQYNFVGELSVRRFRWTDKGWTLFDKEPYA